MCIYQKRIFQNLLVIKTKGAGEDEVINAEWSLC